MTQDEIIEMAREASSGIHDENIIFNFVFVELIEFAKLVAAKEREACALICDEHSDDPVYCGDAIRARGEQA